jgi:patatin-like phospholipase/acyl hydrolase
MEQLSHQRNSSSTLLPCDVFDLIIGTSTGGIIAIMLGRLRMSVDECIDVYTRLAKKVFGHPRSIYRLTGGLVALAGKSMYDKNVLESTLKDIIKQKTGHSSTFLEGGSGCRTIVVAALQEDGGHPVLLRSYSHNDVSESHCCIWEAARATSAASLFFPPIAIGDPPRLYIDGAVSGNCNPALLAVREAESLWPNRPVGCLLSIGTGSPSTIAVKGWIHELAKNFAALATECNRVHEMLEHTYKNRPHSPYFRFSVVGGLAKIRLDEWEEISPNGSGRLAALTDAYMSSHDQVIRLRNCLHQFDDNPVAPQPSSVAILFDLIPF